MIVPEMMGDLSRNVGIAVPVTVGIMLPERDRRFGRIEAIALNVAEIQAEFGLLDGGVDSCAHGSRVVATRSDGDVLTRRVFPAFGEDLHHTADGVRPV